MRVHRRLLSWGVFLVAVGAVLVANDLGAVPANNLSDVLRFWPLALVAIGLSLVFRRSRVSLPLVLVAAAVPGLVVGAAFAVAPNWARDCGGRGGPASTSTRDGRFDGPARVNVRSGCGSMEIRTSPGDAWHYDVSATTTDSGTPDVAATSRTLAIDTAPAEHWMPLADGRQDGTLTLPTSRVDALELTVLAGRADAALGGADLGRLVLTVDAGKVVIDATGASIDELSADVNVGEVAVTLSSAHDLTGSIDVAAARLLLCVPELLDVDVNETG